MSKLTNQYCLKWVNFIIYKLYPKKADFKNSGLSFSDRQLYVLLLQVVEL